MAFLIKLSEKNTDKKVFAFDEGMGVKWMFNLLRLSSVQVRLLIRRELFKECQIVRQLQLVVVVELIWDEKMVTFC